MQLIQLSKLILNTGECVHRKGPIMMIIGEKDAVFSALDISKSPQLMMMGISQLLKNLSNRTS